MNLTPRELPRVTIDTFEREFWSTERPALIIDALSSWKALGLWSPDYLASVLGNKTVRVEFSDSNHFGYTQEKNDSNKITAFSHESMDFATATARITAAGPGHYYVMQHSIPDEFPELLEDFTPPHLVAGREPTTNLWFGSGENVTPLHFDQSNNFFVQVYGRKLWTIFDPSQTRYLYQYPASALVWHTCEVDPEEPDYSRHPAFANAQPIQFTIEPGEMLYLPAAWWHHVRSCETSISVNFWYPPTVEQYFAPNLLRGVVHIYEKMGLSGLEPLEDGILKSAGLSLADAARISLPIDRQVAGLFAMASVDRALRLRMQSYGIAFEKTITTREIVRLLLERGVLEQSVSAELVPLFVSAGIDSNMPKERIERMLELAGC